MTLSFVAMALLAISIHLPSVRGQDSNPTTPNPSVRGQGPNPCNCQCNTDLTWKDENGNIKGNCKSKKGGKPWCYVDPVLLGDCADRVLSDYFENEYWSIIACENSEICKPEYSDLGKAVRKIFAAFGWSDPKGVIQQN